jgi:hypothetical protein
VAKKISLRRLVYANHFPRVASANVDGVSQPGQLIGGEESRTCTIDIGCVPESHSSIGGVGQRLQDRFLAGRGLTIERSDTYRYSKRSMRVLALRLVELTHASETKLSNMGSIPAQPAEGDFGKGFGCRHLGPFNL